jgi:hypothetical protein
MCEKYTPQTVMSWNGMIFSFTIMFDASPTSE